MVKQASLEDIPPNAIVDLKPASWMDKALVTDLILDLYTDNDLYGVLEKRYADTNIRNRLLTFINPQTGEFLRLKGSLTPYDFQQLMFSPEINYKSLIDELPIMRTSV